LTLPQAPTIPFSEFVHDFIEWMRSRQGLSPATVRTYSHKAGVFLTWLAGRQKPLSSVSLNDVDDFLADKAALGWQPSTLTSQAQALRAFFEHAARRGWCAPGIGRGIRSSAAPKYDGKLKGPTWAEVRRLLRSTRGAEPATLRARAILSLCSIYALRSSEVARLRLSDFDWRDEKFSVQRAKQGGVQHYPIQYEVGEAILHYLRKGRPRCPCRHVFVTLHPPYRPEADRRIPWPSRLKIGRDIRQVRHSLFAKGRRSPFDWSAMKLFEHIRSFVERKRTQGYNYVASASILSAFCAHVGDIPLDRITERQVASFLAGPRTSTNTWRGKYGLLKIFFEFWAARGELQALPMPPIRSRYPQTFAPYIYSRRELRHLLRTARSSQKRVACKIESRTLRTLLLFLYATGARTGEARALLRESVDLKKAVLTIHGGRFNRVRHIPIGPDLQKILLRYARWTAQRTSGSANFFVTQDGQAINEVTLNKSFQRLRRIAGIARYEGAHYPRMHDLRHTFAVHRVTTWFKQGADLNRLLPALAAYMGQVGLGSTERYLSMTPERFRNQLVKLSPQRRKRRWSDNPALMRFLAEL